MGFDEKKTERKKNRRTELSLSWIKCNFSHKKHKKNFYFGYFNDRHSSIFFSRKKNRTKKKPKNTVSKIS